MSEALNALLNLQPAPSRDVINSKCDNSSVAMDLRDKECVMDAYVFDACLCCSLAIVYSPGDRDCDDN